MTEELVHYWPLPHEGGRRGTGGFTADWAEVTCGECLLEQPADTRGMPERKLAPEVERRLLAERRERQIAEVQSLADRVLAQSADAALYAGAMDTLRRLRASLALLQASQES